MKTLQGKQLLEGSAPFQLGPHDSGRMMRWVLIAILPVVVILSWTNGPGLLSHLLQLCLYALALEALVARLRGLPPRRLLRDNSALVTAFVLAICLPPATAWWILPIASAIAILLAKHSFGGLGQNPFNPAMVTYVVLCMAFPEQMSGGASLMTVSQIDIGSLEDLSGDSWVLVSLALLAGACLLLLLRVISWQIPFGMLTCLAILAQLWPVDDSRLPGLAVMTAGTIFCAFFIATDPVTSASTALGKLLYGAVIGAVLFAVRYGLDRADAIAIAVLIGNLFAPLLDLATRPRIYGHRARWRLNQGRINEPDQAH